MAQMIDHVINEKLILSGGEPGEGRTLPPCPMRNLWVRLKNGLTKGPICLWSKFYCPGKEAALGIIVSAAADPLYRIPMWIFDCVLDGACLFSLGALSLLRRMVLKQNIFDAD